MIAMSQLKRTFIPTVTYLHNGEEKIFIGVIARPTRIPYNQWQELVGKTYKQWLSTKKISLQKYMASFGFKFIDASIITVSV